MVAILLSPIYIAFHIHALWWLMKWMKGSRLTISKLWIRITVATIYSLFAVSMALGFVIPAGGLQRITKIAGNYFLGVTMYEVMGIIVVDIICIVKRKLFKRSVKSVVDESNPSEAWTDDSDNEAKESDIGTEVLTQEADSSEENKEDSNDLQEEKEGTKKPKSKLRLRDIVIVTVSAFIILISIIGVINARIIRTTRYDININKNVDWMDELNVVMIADLHLGYNTGSRQMKKMVKKINALNPDVVIIAGDIFDNDYDAIKNPDRIAETLSGIKSRYGVYACLGNHDIEEQLFAGFAFGDGTKREADSRMYKFLEDADIIVLQDESILIDNKFYIYGRPDYDRPGRGIDKRKKAEEIVAKMDKKKPIIVIDHQPKELNKLSDAGVDLDLSGHTHNGQMWPGTILTRLMWDNAYGHKIVGDMHSIVTSGIGVFGPDMRVGTKAEICDINIKLGN